MLVGWSVGFSCGNVDPLLYPLPDLGTNRQTYSLHGFLFHTVGRIHMEVQGLPSCVLRVFLMMCRTPVDLVGGTD